MTWSTYGHFAFALVFVLALIGGLALVARRLGYGHVARGPRSRRLALVEVMPVDAKRRLVLVRRDQVEHLLLIGAAGEHVVETGIGATHAFASHLAVDAESNVGDVACAGH